MIDNEKQSHKQKEPSEWKAPIIVGRTAQQPLNDDFVWDAINKSKVVNSTVENGYLNAFISKYDQNRKHILSQPFVTVDLFPRSPWGNFFTVMKDALKIWPYLIGTLLLIFLMVEGDKAVYNTDPTNLFIVLSILIFIISVGIWGLNFLTGKYYRSGLSFLASILGMSVGCAIFYVCCPQIIQCDANVSLTFIVWYFVAYIVLCVINAICRMVWTHKYFSNQEGGN